jgi:hypothetical protein
VKVKISQKWLDPICGKGLFLLFGLLFLFLISRHWAYGEELICGQVRDGFSGEAVEGAVVTCGSEMVHTSVDGYYAIAAVDDILRVRFPGYRRIETTKDACPDISLTPFSPKALYLSFYGVGEPVLRNPALQLIEKTELNALVIDAKGDQGMLSYKSSLPLVAEVGAQRIITVRNAEDLLGSFKKRGIYTIARIVVFKDNLLTMARPDLSVKNISGDTWLDKENLAWADPFSPEVWAYNIDIAEEAAKMGFDEIQFDYVRFPEAPGLLFSKENTQENRIEAITGFLSEARARLAPYNVFLSADIFGYVCWNRNDTNVGQQLEELATHLDYISPMLYPSGFSHGLGRIKNPVQNPYEIVFLSLNRARERTGLPALRFRPWLQAFRDYAFDRRHFGRNEVRAQTLASEEFGANGWMLWNARNVYNAAGLEYVEAKADFVSVSAFQ